TVGELEKDLLEVEDDLGNVLDHAGQAGELVERPLDLDRGDGGAFQRTEQDTAEGVAEGVPVAGLEGFGDEFRVGGGCGALVLLETVGHLESTESDCHGGICLSRRVPPCPLRAATGPTASVCLKADQREYNSTTRRSLTTGAISSRVGVRAMLPL